MIIVKVQGGLGNQLFQYAVAYRLNQDYGYKINLDISIYEGKFSNLFKLDKFNILYIVENKFELINFQKNKYLSKMNNCIYLNSNHWIYPSTNDINIDLLKNPFKKLSKLKSNFDYCINGWMQYIDFVSKYREELSEQITLKTEYINHEIKKSIIKKRNSISIHVRRGDMEKNTNFNILDITYYKIAIKKMQNLIPDPYFFIFSDEPEKAKLLLPKMNNFTFITENSKSTGYYGTNNDYQDFQLMRYCDHHIIANSTFSWWPAYLNMDINSIIIAPKIWFKNKRLQKQFEESGLLLENWIKI